MKAKTGSKLSFLARWIAGHALLAMLVSIMWMNILPATRIAGFFLEGSTWIILLAMQYVLLPYHWRPKLKSWFIGSSIGWIIGMIALQILAFNAGVSERLILYLSNILPIVIAQWLIFREQYRYAWIWAVALITGTIMQGIFQNAVLNHVWLTTMFPNIPIMILTVAIHTVIPTIHAIITGIGFVMMSQSLKQDDNLRLNDEIHGSRSARLEENPHATDKLTSENFVTKHNNASSI